MDPQVIKEFAMQQCSCLFLDPLKHKWINLVN